jgi:hypothetical protein
MQTYWCQPNSRALTSVTSGTVYSGNASNDSAELNTYTNPVEEWLAQQTESQRLPDAQLAPPTDNDAKPQNFDELVDC